jgi:hypothetical protein
MRFMTFVKSAETSGPPPQALMEAMGKLVEEAVQNGTMVLSGGLSPTASATRVRLGNGKVSITDGPFTEAKEVIGGFAVLEVPTREAAVEAAKRFIELHREHWPGWEGESEIRQIFE